MAKAKLHLFGPYDAWRAGLKELQGYEERFPRAKNLHGKAAALRLESFLRLSMLENAEKEIHNLRRAPSMDRDRYAVLLEMANRFYGDAIRTQGNGETGTSGPSVAAALLLYENLYGISRENPSMKQYGQSIQLRMGQLYMKQDKLAQAMELYQDVLARDPSSADAMYHLGLIHEKTEQWEKALHAWRRVTDGVEAGTYHWFQARYHTAAALHKLGKTDKACTIITMTGILHPDLGDPALRERFLSLKSEICETEQGK